MSNLCQQCQLPIGRDAGECDPFPLDNGLRCLRRVLTAKDAEIARLTADLARLGKTSEDAAEAAPLHLGTTAEDWAGMWNVANERANAAETEIARLRAESDELTKARRDALAWAAECDERLTALRAAVMALPEYWHEDGCSANCGCSLCLNECECAAKKANAARAVARKLAETDHARKGGD